MSTELNFVENESVLLDKDYDKKIVTIVKIYNKEVFGITDGSNIWDVMSYRLSKKKENDEKN